ncbi:NADP-dependent oxidoreductase [Streptacidiphilus fuscans]|uniref:NADP-dependent oxidoreductase n=1 Tax=Streptacidiphilus fuscans TaxID=2789292 RepID=A0A931B0J5_9ACTN|nr:NADP-dependent oxidoreductase [Streptacidiphilus fuscans]MBF9068008.1 NADP-dependent oxidoreductase [Streptacidiphilus fuscans]
MFAVQIDRHGGPEVLRVREAAAPVAGAGHVLVATVASTINPVDWKTRAWDVGPAFPMTLGWDLAGVVVATESADFAVGDRVVAMSAQLATGLGTWAELVALPTTLVAHAPASVPLVEAAALPLAGVTALQALGPLDLVAGQRLLVSGALGAVGRTAVALALHRGVVVDGLVSRAEHLAPAAALGLSAVASAVSDLKSASYDAVLDTAGVDVSAALAPDGRYVSVADAPLPEIPRAEKSYVQESRADLAELVRLVDAGVVRPHIAHHFSVRQVRRATELFERGGLTGKVALHF